MKILLTGATGYIGKRLLPVLIENGHEVVCCVRDKKRFPSEGIYKHPNISLFEIDFLKDILLNLSPELNEPYNELLNLAINDVDFSELADTFLKEFCNVY
jgi:nucleoside-diphosphate-sugar epimerase